MANLSAFYPQPVVKGTTAGTYAEGNDSRIVGALPAATAGSGSVLASGSTTSRTLANRFTDRLNILDFGADLTGVNSSRNALIAAIAAASSGDVIYFPKGIYAGIYDITITKSLSIVGDGPDSTIIDTPNNGSYIFGIGANCTNFTCIGMKIQWEGGYVVQAGGGSRCITNIQGTSNINVSVTVDNCVFRNFSESITLWREKSKYLKVTNCKFFFKHGYAGCRWPSNPTNNIYDTLIAGWCIIGNSSETILRNNEFNGLEDPTFTGVPAGVEPWIKTPIDNFYKGSGRPYDKLIIEGNYIKNFAIEGVVLDRYPASSGTMSNIAAQNYDSVCVVRNNVFIGPELVSIASRGVTPAIAYYDGNNCEISNNFIYGAWLGIGVYQQFYCNTNAAANTITIDFSTNADAFLFTPYDNDKIVRFTFVGSGNTGLLPDVPYYIVNSQAPVGGMRTFQVSTTLNGSPVDILATTNNFTKCMPESMWQARKIVISDNTIVNCVGGIFVQDGLTKQHVTIKNNHINVSSEPSKTAAGYFSADTTQSPPPSYTNLQPILIWGGALISDNVLDISDPSWDGTYTLVSRGGVNNNVFTLAAGQAAQLAAQAQQSTVGGNVVTVYGYFTVWNANGNKVWRWPIQSVDTVGNTVTVFSGWATNGGADTYTSGPMYWTKTDGESYLSAFTFLYNTGQEVLFCNNTIKRAWTDIRPLSLAYGTVVSDGTKLASPLIAGAFPDANIVRTNGSTELGIRQGTGAPSYSAPNGSVYLRTDGGASTTLYIRANGAWEPLAAY